MIYKNDLKIFQKFFRRAGKNWRGSRSVCPRKIFAREPLVKLLRNFASVSVRILLKKGSDFVQQTPQSFPQDNSFFIC